ncbi:MAG: HAMP domain-containing sensor histidine kinase [Eubacteriales bacterium]|nr:HAMP domain-containing sensor histidine kinase [Eubacteriales bacterium]
MKFHLIKLNLLSKYILIYIGITIIGFISISTIIYNIDYQKIYQTWSSLMYHQANSIASEFAPDYFSNGHVKIIQTELKTVAQLNQSRIMFIDSNGNVFLDTGSEKSLENNQEETFLYNIPDFDYSVLGNSHSSVGNFYGIFDESTLSVYAPITNSFTTKGYVVVHVPESVIIDRVYTTHDTNYITLMIIMILSLAFIILFMLQIHNPLKDIIKAIKEYGKGNFSYHIEPRNNDEIGHLAHSLNYMASELNETDKFQQKFLSNISHDFRSPLTSIKGYLEAIEDGTIPLEMVNKYINIVLFETDRLTKLTSNILTLNEMDPKTVRLDITIFDINSIIRHIIETFEGNCKARNIKFSLIFANEKEYVKADAGKIQQVIYNLVDNAIKFSLDNSNIDITLREKGEKVYVSIKDYGVGIPKENIGKIFDRFYKSDSSRGRDKKGSGLGLSITKEIIQAHNETIDVVSTPDVGTEFIFTLTHAHTSFT